MARVWLAKASLYDAMRVLKLLATLLASESLMQLEVVRQLPQGVAAVDAVNATVARARTERMLAVMIMMSD